MLICYLYTFFGEVSVKGFGTFFNLVVLLENFESSQRTPISLLVGMLTFVQPLWTARRSNQSILKEISPDYSLEGLMLKLKLQYLGHLKRRADLFEKTLMLGKIEGRRRRG